jgi:amino acid transporter
MESSQRDAGLVRAVGPWSLAASIVNMVVGASIFVIPAALASNVGAYAPLAIIACAIAVGSVAICFAEGGSRMPSSGGAYAYIEDAFGPLVAYCAGTLLWVSDALACGGVVVALADVIVGVSPPRVAPVLHAAIVVAAIGGVTAVNLGGVARGTRLVNATTLLKLFPLLALVMLGSLSIHARNFVGQPNGSGFGRATILALFAFMGMETSLCASGEVERPERNIPRALALAIAAVTLLYVAIQLVAQGVLGAALATSTAPLADAAGRIHPALRVLLLAGAAMSMFGYVCTDILGSPRILFAFARDGLLPRILGRIHGRTHVPYVAIVCYAGLALVLALTGTFAELAVLSALTTAAFDIAGCAAAYRLARRGVARSGPPLNFRWLGAAMTIGIGSMLTLIALASHDEITGLLVLIGASIAIYLVQARVARRVLP